MSAPKIHTSLTRGPDSLTKKKALDHACFQLQEKNRQELRKDRINKAIDNVLDPIDTPFEVEMFTAGKTPIDTPIEMLRYLKDLFARFGQSNSKNKKHHKNEELSSYSNLNNKNRIN